MAKILFIEPGGNEVVVDASGRSLMEAAVEEGVDGIHGDCGGVCSCATCHVQVRADWVDRVGPPSETEQDILSLEDGSNDRSRLCCQIQATKDLDGLVVQVIGE